MVKAVLGESGKRPLISSTAVLNARAGAKALVDLLADEDFADLSIIRLDYEGDGFTPAMIIETFKWNPSWAGRRLEHRWVIDMRDAFEDDRMTNLILRDIVDGIKTAMREKEDEWERVFGT